MSQLPLPIKPLIRIKNPTLAHFRHFSSLFTNLPPSTSVENPLQIDLFMQNKPNFLDAKMNLSSTITTDYENICDWTLGENKPNSNPILKGMNLTFVLQCIMRVNPHSPSARAGRIVKMSSSTLPSVMERGSLHQADKIALKIYPFGIDYPIVLKEMLFTIYGKDYD